MRTAEIPAVTLDEPAPVNRTARASAPGRSALELHFQLLRWFSIPSPAHLGTDEHFAAVPAIPRPE